MQEKNSIYNLFLFFCYGGKNKHKGQSYANFITHTLQNHKVPAATFETRYLRSDLVETFPAVFLVFLVYHNGTNYTDYCCDSTD